MQYLKKTFVASASELQSSDLYMTIKTVMFTVPSANLNGVRCTEAFLDEIIANQDKYVGLPLCADVVNLVKGRYQKLGHCYNPKTGTFSSSMIGSFYQFEKEEMENGEVALIGYARVLKRNKHVCKAICELFANGALKVSFEIACGSYEELDDKTILIDKAENNYLEGMCIVSFPACPKAVAMDLVAEINGIGKEAEDMPDVIETVEVVAEEAAEEAIAEVEETTYEEQPVETAAEIETVHAGRCEKPEKEENAEEQEEIAEAEHGVEQAEIYVTQSHRETDATCVYDSDTGATIEIIETREVTEHGELTETIQAAPAEQAAAEEVASVEEQTEVAEQVETVETDASVEVAEDAHTEETQNEITALIAELQAQVEALRAQIVEMQATETQKQIAEVESVEEINPFIAEISAPNRSTLLDSADKVTGYSLLEKA